MIHGCSFRLQCTLKELLIENYIMPGCWLLIHSHTFCFIQANTSQCKPNSSVCLITGLMCECDGMRSVWEEHPGYTLHTGGDSYSWRFPNKGKRMRETSACVWILGMHFKVRASPGFHQCKYQYCKKQRNLIPMLTGMLLLFEGQICQR